MYPQRGIFSVAVLAAGVLAGALLGVGPALAAPVKAPPAPDPGPAVAGVKPVPSRFAKGANDPAPAYAPTVTAFPPAATVTLRPSATTAPIRASGVPVWVRQVADARGRYSGPAGLQISVLDHRSAVAAGVDGVLFTVTATDTQPGPVRIGLDYSAFTQAYGANFGPRLRLVRLPTCALSTPTVPSCRAATALDSTNDTAARTVSAPVVPGAPVNRSASATTTTASAPMVLAATSDPGQEGGSAGSYAATTLTPSGSWTQGGGTGSFGYNYPIAVPPAASTLVPKVALAYDSSSVDGRTAATQAQASWVGEGWSTPASFIEQSFVPCSDSPEGTVSPVSTQDACYDGPVLTLSLNGSTTSLVWDAGKSVWKPQSDNGSTITHVTNSGNGSGTYNTDYWTVTDRSGTVYTFGRNQLPGWASGKPTTNSVDSEPVYSAHPGDPCYNATFTAAVCTMAYRWSLDYVKDVHGNAEALYYSQDTNFYAQDKGAKMTQYVRDSHLSRIDYGFTDGNAYGTVPDRVVFNTGDRCLSGTCQPLNSTNAPNWPDVPFDLVCNQGATCTPQAPSMFSTVRLTSIAAQQYSVASSSYVTVDSYALSQSFPATGDGTSPTLWLDSVARTGSAATGGGPTTPITLPAVSFGKAQLANRVDNVTDGLPAFYRYRIASVTTETGSVISPTYQLINPCTAPVTLTPATNTSSCYPVSWTPPGYTTPFTDWFNKYVVTKVTITDPTGGAPATATSYVYKDHGAAWHYDDNEVVQAKYRTYGQFRGYSDVITLTGDGANDPQTKSETVYYQGMSKDNNATVVNLTDSAAGVHEDVNELSGSPLETTTYLGNGGPVDHSVITSYWVSAPTATRNRTGLSALTAHWVAPAETYTRQALTDGGTTTWRYTETDTTYDATPTDATVGLVQRVYSHTVPANSAYDRCTGTTYAPVNGGANIVGLAAEVEVDSVACGGFTEGSPASVPSALNTLTAPGSVNRPAQVVSDTRTFYDDPTFATAYPQPSAPTGGEVTMVRKASTWSSGAFVYQTTARSGYDAYGRVTAAYDGNGNATTTAYTMNAVGLTTTTAVTNPLNQTTTTGLDTQRGATLTTTDPNGVVTTRQYDALGRASAVWLYSRSTSVSANYTYTYQVSNTGVTAVTTSRLTDFSAYRTAVTIYDGQLRVRQVQTPTPVSTTSRLVTDTLYDSRGWVRAKYTNWYDANNAPAVGPPVTATGIIPVQDFYTYDGLGRVVVDASEDSGVVKSTTTTVYNGDRTTTIAPSGAVTQATVTDPLGHTVELDQYTTAPTVTTPADTFTGVWSVTGGTTSATRYGYDGHDRQSTVTDAANNTWTTTSNLLGQTVSQSDPDAGTSTMSYDGDGNLLQTTDARGRTVSTTYDALSRKTGLYDAPSGGQSSSNQLAAWVYDNTNNVAGVTNPVGHLTTETAYWGGAAYTTQYKGFNVFGRSLGETVTIPSNTEGSVLGTSYAFSHVYTATNGLLLKDIYPAAGGLPAETVLHTYTGDDLPNGLGVYAQQTAYDAWGRVGQETIGSSPNETTLTNLYDRHTGKLAEQIVTDQILTAPATVNDEAYTYDPAGNLTRQVSTRSGASSPTETQCFTYDPVDRLTNAWTATDGCAAVPSSTNHGMVGDSLGSSSAYWASWGFDPLGDRTSQVQHSTTGGTDTTTTYSYDGNAAGQPHTLTGTASTGGSTGTTSYGYDVSGNMTARNAGQGAQTLTWDDDGRLSAVASTTNGTSSFEYDADGNLLIQKDPGTSTLYLENEQIVLNTAAGTTTSTRYYPLPGGASAVRTGSGSTAYQFEITDEHGTPALYLDNTAQHPTWRQFTPYGAPRGASVNSPDNHAFLNKPADTSTGLTEVGARDYDPATGRFISVDPEFDAKDPQQLNGYSYAGDEPTVKSDPTGRRPICGDDDGRPHPCGPADGYNPNPSQHDIEYPGGDSGSPTVWGPMLNKTQDEIDAQCRSVNSMRILELMHDFWSGEGPRDEEFYQVDEMTMAVRGSSHMNDVRTRIADRLASGYYMKDGRPVSDDYNVPEGMEGGSRATMDALRAGVGVLGYNDPDKRKQMSISAIGSYKLDYQVVAIDHTTGRAIVAFHASNTWDVKSAIRNPFGHKTSGGPTGPSSGKFSALTVNFYWTETVSF